MARRTALSGGRRPGAVDAGREVSEVVRALDAHQRTQEKEEQKADKLENKADKLEKKLDGLGQKIDKMEKKADKLEPKLDKLEKKYDKIEAKLDKIEQKLDKPKDKKDERKAAFGAGAFADSLRFERGRSADPVFEVTTATISAGRSGVRLLRWKAAERGGEIRFDGENEKRLDEQEADLDKAEELYDKEEKNLDKAENALDKLEEIYDRREKNADEAEKQFDEAEKALDGSKPHKQTGAGGRSRQARVGRRRAARSHRPSARATARAAQVASLIRALREGRAGEKKQAQKRLEQLGAAATTALVAAYDSPDEHFRWQVVNLLGYTRDARAIGLLVRKGIHDPEIHPRWRSIWALTSVDDGKAAGILRAQVARSRGLRRRNAAVALSLFRDPAAIPVLRAGLAAADPWVRWESASCLAGYADGATARRMMRTYRGEKDTSIRRELIRAMGGVADRNVLKFLRYRLAEADPQIRLAAVHALSLSLNGRSEPVLTAHLARERTPFVRRAIRETLAALPRAKAG